MARKKAVNKYTTSDGFAYLTKRTLVGRAQAAGRAAAQRAMTVMGYVITQQDGLIIKKYQNGEIEILQEIKPATSSQR